MFDTFPTHGPLFVGLLVGVIVIVGLLTYFPALALGPIVERLLMLRGKTFSRDSRGSAAIPRDPTVRAFECDLQNRVAAAVARTFSSITDLGRADQIGLVFPPHSSLTLKPCVPSRSLMSARA